MRGIVYSLVFMTCVAALAALVLFVSNASASWYMRYDQAWQASEGVARRTCLNVPTCLGWEVGPCVRRSPARFDCAERQYFRFVAGERELEQVCETVLHWGASRWGLLVLKGATQPYCSDL